MDASKYIRETPKLTDKVDKIKDYILKPPFKVEEASKVLATIDGTTLAFENSLTQLGLLSMVIQGLEKGTLKISIDCLTDHLSSFLVHAQNGQASEIFQKEIIKDIIQSIMESCAISFKKLKIPSAALRPLRIFLTEWYPSYVANILHFLFAEFAITAKAYHYAYPLVKQRALKAIANSKTKGDLLLQYNYQRGLILLRNGDYERALEAFAMSLNAPQDMSSFLFRIPGFIYQSYIYVQILGLYLNKKPDFMSKLIKQDHEIMLFFRKEMDLLGDVMAEKNLAKLKLYCDREQGTLKRRELKGIFQQTIAKLEEEEALTQLKCFNKVSLKEFDEEMKKNEIEGGRVLKEFQKRGIFTLDQKTSQLKIRSTEKTQAKLLQETIADVSECLNNAKEILLGMSVHLQFKAGSKIQTKKK